jgi:hypothetical protein
MSAVIRGILLVAATALSVSACASGPERQWYKPGGNYSVAEFQRDQAACTKNREVDEECLKTRGWIPISADKDKGPAPLAPVGKSRY